MKKRSVLAPVKKIEEPPPESEEQPPERADLDDKEIFELPTPKTEQEQKSTPAPTPVPSPEPEVKPEKPKSKRQQRDYSYLQEARQKSLETRRRKAEEKKRMEEELASYKEQLQFERLSNKVGRMEISQPEPPQPQPVSRPAPPTSVASTKPEHDISHNIIDYDRLIGGVAERLQSQNDYFSQLEHDIRADERKKAEATYQEQLKAWEKQQHRQYQREQAYGAMSNTYKRNHVFDRTTKLRQQYTERYKNGWY